MGGCMCFMNYDDIYSQFADVGRYREDFFCLNVMEESVGRMYKVFKSIDLDSSGLIDSDELFEKLKMDNNKFSRRIFQMYDLDKSGKIDFREFVLITWNFCTIEKQSLEKFIFDMYDTDGLGCIETKEVDTFIKDIYGRDYLTNQNVQRALHEGLPQCRSKYHDSILADNFHVFCNRHPFILYPIAIMQSNLRDITLGSEYWREMTAHRQEICDGSYIPFQQLFKELRSGRRERTRSNAVSSEKALSRQLSNAGKMKSSSNGSEKRVGSQTSSRQYSTYAQTEDEEDYDSDTLPVSRQRSQDRREGKVRRSRSGGMASHSPEVRMYKSYSSKNVEACRESDSGNISGGAVLPSVAIAARKKSISRRSYSSSSSSSRDGSSEAVSAFLQKQISQKSRLQAKISSQDTF